MQSTCVEAGATRAPSSATLKAMRILVSQNVTKPKFDVGGTDSVSVGLTGDRGSADI